MKQTIFALVILLITSAFVSSGLNSSDERKALSAKKIVFLGVNFTQFKLLDEEGFIGKNGDSKCKALKFKYFEDWNDVFLIEKDKFNLNNLLLIDNYSLFLDPTIAFNKEINIDECLIGDLTYKVSQEKIQNIIDQYIGIVDGEIAVIIIGESMSKKLGKGAFTIVYFEPLEGKILLSNRYEEAPSGYGFDNYWVNTIHNSLQANEKFIKKTRKAYKIK